MITFNSGSVLLRSVLLILAVAGSAAVPQSVSGEETRMRPRDVDAFIQPLFEGYDLPRARNAVTIQELLVSTYYPDGTPTEVRVQLFVPDIAPRDVAGVYLFAPGSTGLIEPCRPSREHEAGIRWGLYRAHVLAFAGRGMIGIIPDYIGFGDWHQVQPYFHAESEARVVFEAFHAVHRHLVAEYPGFEEGLAPYTRVAGGFSQGGHAVFAAADWNSALGADLPLHGVIGYGATTEILPLFLTFPSLAPMVLESFRSVYGGERIDPARILLPEWAETLTYDTTRQCVGGIQAYYPGDADALFDSTFLLSLREGTLEATHPEEWAVFQENTTGLTRHGIPALLLQGTEDIVISPATQERFVESLQSLGNPVDFHLFRDTRHDTRQRAFPQVEEWIRNLR